MTDTAKLKAAAEKATALNLDSAELKRGHSGYLECPCCEGAGYVEEENDFCNIDGVALGVQFYGIGPYHGLAEEYLRLAKPAAVLELIAALEAKDAQIAELLEKQRLIDICQGQGLEHRIAAERRAESAEKRAAELEARIVRLPQGYVIRAGHPINEGERHVMVPKDGGDWLSVFDVEHALRAAGINLETGGEA
ncbi:hypothetical protein SNQ28_000623 [Cronobacter malonaticus]|uniref:hypothetical protein n=1 Tax=Cronobacter malonaticus TaxID=413503 RepID=UPI00067C0FE9|nr:hypothetical protein [Cronobacter malonaticus]EGT4373230.1 hypothetical protein [Cronobacter malonaticus]ELY6201945.1 hypothetical protein [Cronobacter malonaticus]ELY6256609.1 hypothetical protein [Cronobacter malonaticus]MDI6469447.1 hypothetical protein [Cronobacter malonaticus]HAU5445733.1 hypothetical protein [Cronobacter malonaticus]